jgi:hypothetical protein
MTCAELQPEYDPFAFGAAEPDIREEIRAHIARGCQECGPSHRRALELLASMAMHTTPVDPPPRLRRKVLAMVSPEAMTARRLGFGWNLIWGATAILAVSIATLLGVQVRRLSALRLADGERFQRVTQIVSSPDTLDVRFGGATLNPPSGHVFLHRERGVALIASNLPKLSQGKTLEMWRLPKAPGAKPIPAGTFRPEREGWGYALDAQPVNPQDLTGVAVTIEPEGGSSQPTSQPILIASLK